MSLSQATLKSEFLKMMDSADPNFVGWPTTKAQGTINWANAYDTYALAARDLSGDSLLAANLAGLKAQLLALMPNSNPGGTIDDAAEAFEQAFLAYWTGATFAVGTLPIGTVPCPNLGGNTFFSVENTSIVTAVTPGVLKGLLLAEFATSSSDAATKADSLATAFHTATTTAVFVTIAGLDTTPPPAIPSPITNTCTIF